MMVIIRMMEFTLHHHNNHMILGLIRDLSWNSLWIFSIWIDDILGCMKELIINIQYWDWWYTETYHYRIDYWYFGIDFYIFSQKRTVFQGQEPGTITPSLHDSHMEVSWNGDTPQSSFSDKGVPGVPSWRTSEPPKSSCSIYYCIPIVSKYIHIYIYVYTYIYIYM